MNFVAFSDSLVRQASLLLHSACAPTENIPKSKGQKLSHLFLTTTREVNTRQMQTEALPIVQPTDAPQQVVVEKVPEKEGLFKLEEKLLPLFNDPTLDRPALVERVKALVAEYSVTEKDWEKYCFFSDLHYTRNLAISNDKFELIILCWKAGQASRIHNHAGSNCWLGVLSGTVVESLYSKVEDGKVISEQDSPSQPGPCPELHLDQVSHLKPGEVGYIHDTIGLHRIAAAPEEDGVSLHVYSPPISIATLFDIESNSVVQRTPGFYSIGGRRSS